MPDLWLQLEIPYSSLWLITNIFPSRTLIHTSPITATMAQKRTKRYAPLIPNKRK